MLTDKATKAAYAPATLLAVSCCCAFKSELLQLSETQNNARHACGENIFKQVQLFAALLVSVLLMSDKVQDCVWLHVILVCFPK